LLHPGMLPALKSRAITPAWIGLSSVARHNEMQIEITAGLRVAFEQHVAA
jgi:hypothetical protein